MKRKKEYCVIDGKQYEVSPSMACDPICGGWLISVCDVCKNYNKEQKTCSKVKNIPEEYGQYKKHDCPERDIDISNTSWQLIRKELGL